MRVFHSVKALSLSVVLLSGIANAATTGSSAFVNYTWLDAVVNKTPVVQSSCPEINTDIYGAGFKVALQKSFYGSVSASGSRWFPKNELWTSVGVGPLKNNFGILFSDINTLSELKAEKNKHLPDNYEEINSWKVSDSAYWESQGGVSFYLGAGIAPIDIGVFAVATGGWVNFLQKTGPNRVYVEMSKKKIKSISFGVGMGRPNISVEKAFENSKGFAYEFVLDNQESIEAFERFMAGDITKSQDLSKFKDSGVNKISDMSESRVGVSRSFGIATPFIPILSFKTSSEKAYDHSEENSVWDENVMKDTGIYIKQRNTFIVGQQLKEVRSFIGGNISNEAPSLNGTVHTEKLYGDFKYSYQSNWGQEKRLRKYLSRVKSLTGLVDETCARVPSFQDSLGFNQIVLEVKMSDDYVRELIGLNKSNNLLSKIKASALAFQADKANSLLCARVSENENDSDSYDDTCSASNPVVINAIFANLSKYASRMNASYKTDKKEFSKNLASFGQEVWKSPFVFKAFFERGKLCGLNFKFEIAGQRLTRHLIDQKFTNTEACTK